MNMYTNTKKSKKFILILVLLMLFNFMCPRQVNASVFDFGGNISSFFFMIERAVIKLANDMFCDEEHDYEFDPEGKNGEAKIEVWMTAESIIKGKFVLFDANIFQEVKDLDESGDIHRYYDDGNSDNWVVRGKNTLRSTIAGWYYSLLNFAIVALLSVLVYVGIRMITSTISQDKAKYKIMFKDWLVAICLLVLMHYMMIGILNITSMITDAIGTDGGDGNQISHIMSIVYNINEAPTGKTGWGDVRYKDGENEYTLEDAFKYEILLGFMASLTCLFMWKYLKREFTIIFLILLGPISCITYPIDKISDGKAQAFNKWLTEFIYNVLIQPFHLLLYLVLVGSAVELANENLIYGLAVLTMLIPAEKFVKEMFGFRDKLGSPLGAMAAGAAGGQLLSKMMKGGTSGSSGGGNTNSNTIKNKNIDQSLLTSGDGATPQTTDLTEGDDSVAPQTTDLPEGDDSVAPQTTDLTEGDDSVAPQTTDLPEEDDSEAIDSDTDESSSNPRTVGRTIKGFAGKVWETHNQRATEKHGEAAFWKRQGVKAGKGVRALAKVGLKGAGALAGGFASAMLGKGFVAGAAGGWAVTGKAVDGVSNVVKDYADRMRTPEQREKKAFKDFKLDKAQQKKAIESFMERHEGRPPTTAEFDQEMKDRFAMARYGMKDEQIDDCIELYQDVDTDALEKAALENGISLDKMKKAAGGPDNLDKNKYRAALEKELAKKEGGQAAIERAKAISGSKAAYTSKLGKRTSAKDLVDQKAVANLYNDIFKGLKAANSNCSDEEADRCAREYLTNAGKIHSVKNVALPPPLKVKLPPKTIERNNAIGRLSSRGVSTPSEEEIRQEIILHQKLVEENHFSEKDISKLNELAVSSGQDYKVIVNRVLKVEGEWQKGKTPKELTEFLGRDAGREEIRNETIERLEIEFMTGTSDKNRISDIRNLELTVAKGDAKKIQEIRQVGARAISNGGKILGKDSALVSEEVKGVVNQYITANRGPKKVQPKKVSKK